MPLSRCLGARPCTDSADCRHQGQIVSGWLRAACNQALDEVAPVVKYIDDAKANAMIFVNIGCRELRVGDINPTAACCYVERCEIGGQRRIDEWKRMSRCRRPRQSRLG